MRSLLKKVVSRGRRELRARKVLPVRKDSDCLKWAIVGTGYMATIWADLLLSSPIGELHAVCSRSTEGAQSFGRKFGCQRRYNGLDRLLVEEGEHLDFVYVATPLHSHFAIIKSCLKAGLNVLTEKPATSNAQEWLELTALAKAQGALLIEGMWTRCLPTFRQADAWIKEGLIGDVQEISANLNKFQPYSQGKLPEETGVLMDYGVYVLAFGCHFLGGEPARISSRCDRDADGRDTAWSIKARRHGKTAIIGISSKSRAPSKATVVGEIGTIEWSEPFNRTDTIALRRLGVHEPVTKTFDYRQGGFEYQLAEVTRTLREGLPESEILSHRLTLSTLNFAERIVSEADGPQTLRGQGASW